MLLLPALSMHRHRVPGVHHVGRRYHGLASATGAGAAATVCGADEGGDVEHQSEGIVPDRRGSYIT